MSTSELNTFVSLFAGVGGFDLGLERSGYKCIGQVEIDKHANTVLEKHWPDVPRHDDVQTAKEWADEIEITGKVDIVCGGFPCQDVSVAGKRSGLAGVRSGLFFDALSFATHVKAKRIILENVPGLLSSNEGRDFGVVLTSLADAGYSNIEWRVLDSQFFGVPQRRRRVFIIGSLGTERFTEVLAERESVRGNFAPRNKAREGIATSSSTSVALDSGKDIANYLPAVNQDANNGHVVVTSSSFGGYKEGVGTLRAEGGDLGGGSENLVVHKE